MQEVFFQRLGRAGKLSGCITVYRNNLCTVCSKNRRSNPSSGTVSAVNNHCHILRDGDVCKDFFLVRGYDINRSH